MSNPSHANPFYLLLVICGIAFSITACAYAVLTFRAVHGAETPAFALLDRHGTALLGGELVLLALATVGAIGTDGRWGKQGHLDRNGESAVRKAESANDVDQAFTGRNHESPSQ